MAESSGALMLACLVLVYIDECIFGMRHSFQYIMANVLSKSVVSLSYTMTTLAGGFLVTNHYDAGRKVSKSNLDRGRKQKRPLR